MKIDMTLRDSFRVLVAVDGSGEVSAPDGTTMMLKRGETVFVPAATPGVSIRACGGPLKLITVFIE